MAAACIDLTADSDDDLPAENGAGGCKVADKGQCAVVAVQMHEAR